MAKPIPWILRLEDAGQIPPMEVGAKAASLAEMLNKGFPVPSGWVVTEKAFQFFCSFNAISCDTPKRAFLEVRKGKFPQDLAQMIIETVHSSFSGNSFAVRSSSAAEDGVVYSMAGQFDTLLHVDRHDLLDAIKKCWASRFGQPVMAYLKQRKSRERPSMGVILQKQITPRFSGVLFTLNPVDKSTDRLPVEWVKGLGEKLVSGKVVPERTSLHRASAALPDNLPAELLGPLRSLRNFALAAEELFGQPIDMEWCCDREELYILQARPITGIFGLDEIAWTNTNMAENFPMPLAPFAWSVIDAFYTAYMKCALRISGWNQTELARVTGVLATLNGVHCGRIYYNLNSWYEVMHLFPIGNWLSTFLDTYIGQKTKISFQPAERMQQAKGCVRRLIHLLLFWPRLVAIVTRAKKRLDRLEPEFHQQRKKWRDVPAGRDSAKYYLDTIQEILSYVDIHWGAPIAADLKVMVFTGLLEVLIRRWVSSDVNVVMAKMMGGIEVKSTEPSKCIWAMAQLIKHDQNRMQLLEGGDYITLESTLDEEQSKLLYVFMEEFGGRCYHDCMIVFPTFEERHDLFWNLVKSYAIAARRWDEGEKVEASEKRKQSITKWLQPLPWWKKIVFRQILRSARDATELRERGRLLQSLLFGEFRRVALELGKRLAWMNHLQEPEDIFYLQLPELKDIIEGKFQFPETLTDIIIIRKRACAEADHIEAPEFFLTGRGEYYSLGKGMEQEQDTCSLRGVGVSGGKRVGRVKIILDPSMPHDLQHGDILVTRTTDPGWTPLFFIAGGLILERGGMLSHGAIVAREFGVPAIVAMQKATKILEDGALVEIDGTAGTVTLLEESSENAIYG